jgi:hypothetical protein
VIALWFLLILEFAHAKTSFPDYDFRLRLDTIGGYESQTVLENSLYNPGNQFLELSSSYGFLELRPDIDLSLMKRLRFVVRPRIRGMMAEEPSVEPRPEPPPKTTTVDRYYHEAFVSVKPISSVEVSAGRQNFQWGPSEILNPSNLFFPDLLLGIQPYYEVRGRPMLRLNLSLGENWSLITLGEVNALNDEHYETMQLSDDENQHRVQTKLEYNWNNSTGIFGLTLGRRETSEDVGSLGIYSSINLNDAWQFYLEGRADQGSDLLVLSESGALSSREPEKEVYFIGLAGLRYTFSGGTEFRIEEIHNDLAFSARENRILQDALANPTSQFAALPLAFQSQGGLPGRDFIYTALRWSSPGDIWPGLKQPIWGLRGLNNLEDGSSLWWTSFETGLTDSLSSSVYGGLAFGDDDTSLRRTIGGIWGGALKWSL